jgi:hypothetical protein
MYSERVEERTARRNTDIGHVIVASFEGARKTAADLPEMSVAYRKGSSKSGRRAQSC